MGWSSVNIGCSITADKIYTAVAGLEESGLKDAGYNYVILDDCWQADSRDDNGHLQPDSDKFPDGMKALGDFIHKAGFKFGIYASAGTKTCKGKPGSYGYEDIDAQDFADWGIDYLKYSNCYYPGTPAEDRFKKMGDSLKATNREIFYAINNWGNERVSEWGPDIANSW